MGCDIHAYVEYTTWSGSEGSPWWSNLTANFGSRDYLWFGILADVRHEGDCLYPPRGLPDGLAWETQDGAFLRADDQLVGQDGYCSVEQAKKWGGYDPETGRVPHPDWHSHSWLTTEEFGHCIAEHMKLADYPLEVGWLALFTAMKTIEDNGGKARIVFWFDN